MSENMMSEAVEAIDFEGILAALEAANPTKKAVRKEAFARLFPTIESAISRNIPQKQILKILADKGLKLSAATFKKLLEETRKNQRETEKVGVPEGSMLSHATGDQISVKYGQGGAR